MELLKKYKYAVAICIIALFFAAGVSYLKHETPEAVVTPIDTTAKKVDTLKVDTSAVKLDTLK